MTHEGLSWRLDELAHAGARAPRRGLRLIEDLVYSFEPGEADAAIAPWLTAAPGDPAVGWTAAQLAEHVREEHSTFTWLLEPMLERVGFEIRDRWLSPTRMYAAHTCIRR